MPTSLEHLNQARANEAFLRELGRSKAGFPDWEMTILAYAALHHVQAGFACLLGASAPSTHQERSRAIKTVFPSIAEDYGQLYAAGRQARYDCISPKRQQLQEAEKRLSRLALEIKVDIGIKLPSC